MTKPAWAFYRDINIAMTKGTSNMQELADFAVCESMGISQEQLDIMAHVDVLKWGIILSRRAHYQRSG